MAMASEPPTSAMAAEEAQAAERRASLQAFIDQKKYVRPGDGSLAPGYLGYNVSSPGGGTTLGSGSLQKNDVIDEEEEEQRRREEAVRRQTQGLDGTQAGAKSDAVEGYLKKMEKEQQQQQHKKKRLSITGWLQARKRRGSKEGGQGEADVQ